MSDAFIGEIRMVGFNFAPTGWAQCNGQILPIAQNTALFSILGTYYGGNGSSTFALPDLMDSVPLGINQEESPGQTGGSASVTLITTEIPAHTHQVYAPNQEPNTSDPSNAGWARSEETPAYRAAANTTFSPQALSINGGIQPHNNLQPYLAVNFIIALQGFFPSHG